MIESPCENCILGQVLGYGEEDNPLVLIAENPGKDEVDTGTPFTGTAGYLLHQTLDQLCEEGGFPKPPIFYTNSFLCVPRGTEVEQENYNSSFRAAVKTIKKDKTDACRARLRNTLMTLQPKVIVAMGEGAVMGVLNTDRVLPHFNKFHQSPFLVHKHRVLVTYNPGSPLHKPETYRSFTDTLDTALRLWHGLIGNLPDPILEVAQSLEDVRRFLSEWEKGKSYTLDLETGALDTYLDKILCLCMSVDEERHTYIIPWKLITKEFIPDADFPNIVVQTPSEGFEEVKTFLENNSFTLHNATFDENFLRAKGIEIGGVDSDPMLLHYAMDERTGVGTSHGLKPLSAQYLGINDWEKGIWSYVKRTDSFEKIPTHILYSYAKHDPPNTKALDIALKSRATAEDMHVYNNILLPFREMLSSCQSRGVYIDIDRLIEIDKILQDQMDRVEKLLRELCGLPFINIGSTQQVQNVLYKDFGLAPPTDSEGIEIKGTGEKVVLALLKGRLGFLKFIRHQDEYEDLIALVREAAARDLAGGWLLGLLLYRDINKDQSTYIRGLSRFISPLTNCVHPFTHITGTETGRFSGSRPSLLNIKNSNRLKSIFAARPGYKLIYADQSQFELRIYACISKDKAFRDILAQPGVDIHSWAGRQAFPWYDNDPKIWRSVTKTIVFGILYRRTAYALAKTYNFTLDKAIEYRNKILDLFKTHAEYEEMVFAQLRKEQVVRTPFGRVRRYPFLPPRKKAMIHILNSAVNNPIQSTASDINSFSMHDIWKAREETGVYPLFPIHDALLFEVEEHRVEEGVAYVKEMMETAPVRHLGEDFAFCPFVVEPHAGNNWGELSEEEYFFSRISALAQEVLG